MVVSGLGLVLLLVLSSVAASVLALCLASIARSGLSKGAGASTGMLALDEPVVFLFENKKLVDATRSAEAILHAVSNDTSDWEGFWLWLALSFPDAQSWISSADVCDTFESQSSMDGSTLRIDRKEARLRVTLEATTSNDRQGSSAQLSFLEREIDTLRTNEDAMPYPMWRQDVADRITWVNRAYLETLSRMNGPDSASRWPTPALFDLGAVSGSVGDARPLRAALGQSNNESWYEIHTIKTDEGLICSALDINPAVRAERKLREFTQTLSRTFADLNVGLAIFDRARRLAIFNPALADLTHLSAGFLAGHPGLGAVLDRMRDAGRVPEPRNYPKWRERIVSLDISAGDADFSETWTLSDGQTLRVTARPHPDGAVAFIFEDISSELALTRRFRAELDAGRSVLDQVDEAIAVFSSTGVLTMSNRAYSNLWNTNQSTDFAHLSITDAAQTWESQCLPSLVWSQATTFVHQNGVRQPWTSDVTMRNGRAATFRIAPLSGGSTLIGFTPHNATSGELRFRRRAS